MAAANGLVIERILRDREGIWRQIIEERKLRQLTGQMLASSAIALAVYGFVLGFFNSFAQAAVSMVKLPILFLVTLAICLPTLYLFNLVFGAKLSIGQAVSLVMTSITVMSTLALAFAPISLFFLLTAPNYSFFKLLNVAILVLSATVGLKFLTSGMVAFNEHHERQAARTALELAKAEAAEAPKEAEAEQLALVAVAAPQNGAVVAPMSVPVQPHPMQQHPGQPHPGQRIVHPVHPGHPGYPGQQMPQQRPASMSLLYIWILLFGFVGTQLGWTLRPFFGDKSLEFQLFRGLEGNFYVDVVRTISHLF
ncbi:proline-rich domain-containing protein [Longispora albida]|uniref:proline-rich domain-containing protein n=1 Tax=Longispora albida TaxID=203523 RepID=UPI000382E911|nr:proline-rich domain-containing protein [Longispora albida]